MYEYLEYLEILILKIIETIIENSFHLLIVRSASFSLF